MKSSELSRVQDDLDLIKAALGSEFPYDRRHVVMCLLVAGVGVISLLIAIPEWREVMRTVLVVYVLFVLAMWYWQVRQASAERTARPRAWTWTRRETSASILASVLLILYVITTHALVGQREGWGFLPWRDYVAGPITFFAGVGVSCVCMSVPERRHGLGWGIAAILGGLAVPWCQTYGQTMLVLGAVMIVGGLASAGILYRQIRQLEIADVGN